MALALALSPAYVIRPHLGPLPTTVLELVLGPAILVGLLAYWRDLPWRNPFTWPALLLLLAATLDSVFAPDRRAALGLWKAYFVEPVAAGLVIAAMARGRPNAQLLLAGLAVAGTVAAILNLAADGQALANHAYSNVTPPVAVYNSANATALYLEPLIAFALAIALYSDAVRERWLAGGLAALFALADLFSDSRLGWITLGALCLFVAAFHARRWWAYGLAVIGGGLAFALSQSVRDRILVEFDPGSPKNTLVLRASLWRSTLNMLLHQPLFGGGLSGFRRSIEPYRDPNYHEDLIYPHNLALNLWSETGLLGLAAFTWLSVQLVRVALPLLRRDPWRRALAIGLLGMLVAFVVHGIGDVPYFKNDQSLAFWALLAIPLGAASDNQGAP
ncbi:MAG: O-antigen ligase family protein [Chloroflexi bacterium]|nr:MAG: O-antigen ligase family protein [Chloroflexota bacterium]